MAKKKHRIVPKKKQKKTKKKVVNRKNESKVISVNDIELLLGKIPPAKWRGIEFFWITETEVISIRNGSFKRSWTREEFGKIKSMKFKRGEILEEFCKLETLINFLIKTLWSAGNFFEDVSLNIMLSSINLNLKLRILNKDRDGISNPLYSKLIKLKGVRNSIAHTWHFNQIEYNKDYLSNNFRIFKKDFEEAFRGLVEIYRKESKKNDLLSSLYDYLLIVQKYAKKQKKTSK